jgi:hypothetical protein
MLLALLIFFLVIAWFTKSFFDEGSWLGALVGVFALVAIAIFGFNVAVAQAKASFCSVELFDNLPVCRSSGYYSPPSWQRPY